MHNRNICVVPTTISPFVVIGTIEFVSTLGDEHIGLTKHGMNYKPASI